MGEREALFAAATAEYAGIPHHAFYCGHGTPSTFDARLQLEGYERQLALIMVLEGELRGTSAALEIRQIENEEGWSSYQRAP